MSFIKIISEKLKSVSGELKDLSLKIHANPELGLLERKACGWQTELLKKHGFEVKSPCAGLETAYFASIGKGSPSICFIAEYDALPGIGHGCGHNLICSTAIGAGIALKELMEKNKIKGRLAVIGTPAEEGLGGKLSFIKSGLFKDIDAAFLGHPEHSTAIWNGALAIRRFDVQFIGKASHASTSPEEGINALDAVTLLFQGVNAMRQHIHESSRLHGIITSGGSRANVVPEFASCLFYIRADSNNILEDLIRRFRNIVKGAALMTGAKYKIKEGNDSYQAGIPLDTLNCEFRRIAAESGLNPVEPEKGGRGSTDFGDVSQIVPGIHFHFGICDRPIPLHSADFAKAAASKFALDAMLKAAETMALLGHKFLTSDKFRKEVRKEFEGKRKSF